MPVKKKTCKILIKPLFFFFLGHLRHHHRICQCCGVNVVQHTVGMLSFWPAVQHSNCSKKLYASACRTTSLPTHTVYTTEPPTMAAPKTLSEHVGLWQSVACADSSGSQLFQRQCPAECINTPNRILILLSAWGQRQTGVVFEHRRHPGWFLIDWLLTSGQTASVCSQNDPSRDVQLRVDDVIVEVRWCQRAIGDRRSIECLVYTVRF